MDCGMDNPCGDGQRCAAMGQDKICICPAGFSGPNGVNEPAPACIEYRCVQVSCGIGASCDDLGENDGYTCTCDHPGFLPGEPVHGESVQCIERTCEDSDGEGTAADCGGDGTVCEDLDDNNGYNCRCDDGYVGEPSALPNAPVTCTRPICDDTDTEQQSALLECKATLQSSLERNFC